MSSTKHTARRPHHASAVRPSTPASPKRIPVNLIAGPLGVGKTTTINHLLQQRPEGEQWAVLVNEYGLIGVDAALMQGHDAPGGSPAVEIREVAGGCICCSAGFMFEMSLVLLLQRRPDRLLIEPTGLAALSGILDTLDREGIRESVDVRSVVCLLEPAHLGEAVLREEVRDQVEAADVVLASRSDLATADQLQAFDAWARALFPAKRFVGRIERGQVPLAFLDLVSGREGVVRRVGHRHEAGEPQHAHEDAHHAHEDAHHAHEDAHHVHEDAHHAHEDAHHAHEDAHHAHDVQADVSCDEARPIVRRVHRSPVASTVGWICWAGLVFDTDRVSSWLRQSAKLPGTRRIKAVLRTTAGWQGFNLSGGAEDLGPSGHRRDSRLEMVLEDGQFPDADALEYGLLGCLSTPLAAGAGPARDRAPR